MPPVLPAARNRLRLQSQRVGSIAAQYERDANLEPHGCRKGVSVDDSHSASSRTDAAGQGSDAPGPVESGNAGVVALTPQGGVAEA